MKKILKYNFLNFINNNIIFSYRNHFNFFSTFYIQQMSIADFVGFIQTNDLKLETLISQSN